MKKSDAKKTNGKYNELKVIKKIPKKGPKHKRLKNSEKLRKHTNCKKKHEKNEFKIQSQKISQKIKKPKNGQNNYKKHPKKYNVN